MVDANLAKQSGAKMFSICTGGALTKLIDIGYQTGSFESSKLGPATNECLGERSGLNERYVREWLGAMATSGWGQQSAKRGLAEAGFGSVEILNTRRPQNCSYVCLHSAPVVEPSYSPSAH